MDDGKASLKCRKCKSSFHPGCDKNKEQSSRFVCYDCKEIESFKRSPLNKFGFEKLDKTTLNEMLMIVFQSLLKDPAFKNQKKSIRELKEKIDKKEYVVSTQFLQDCKKIEHQWKIVDKNLPDLIKEVQILLDDLEQCVHCFKRFYHDQVPWINSVCPRPHLLVWVKTEKVNS